MVHLAQKARAVFEQALELSSDIERESFLDDACAGTPELRDEVNALLKAHASAGSFLNVPMVDGLIGSLFSPPLSEQPGTVIGPYKLLQQIGEGGMGVVFMAQQTEPLQRTVALKIIKPGMDTRQVIARFEAERQALAMMDHPNIAKVLGAGATESGRPYFVMELVKGVPITKYCDDKHLSLRERLELLLPVCQAVQHAHQKGIIHRDIKPTNVLVAEYDNDRIPKVIDFGVAKATAQKLTERTMFTEFGQVLGTVEYMSPEQAKLNQLDVDTRSDIYSLGVLLYELLTGSTPLERDRLHDAAFDEMLRIIREEEPPKPSMRLTTSVALPSIAADRRLEPEKLRALVRGELDWIVMKCLEKDRNRRYETAVGFGADLQRYLDDEEVEACPPSATYRFGKFARRNRVALSAAAASIAALLVVVVGLAVSNRLIVHERNAKSKALAEKEQALTVAEAERKRAEASFWQAAVSIRDIITRTALGREDVPLPVRRKFTNHAIKFYQTLLREDSADPTLRYEMAVGVRTLGMIHSSWDEFVQAEQSFQKAIAILERLATDHRDVQQYRHQLGYAHLEFSRLLTKAGRVQEADAMADRGIQLYEDLLTETPGTYDYVVLLTHFYVDAVKSGRRVGRMQNEEDPYRRVIDLLTTAANTPNPSRLPGMVTSQATLGHQQRDIAVAFRQVGRLDEAEDMFRKAISTFDTARDVEPEEPQHWHFMSDTHRLIGLLKVDREELEAAEKEFRRAMEIQEGRATEFPNERVHDYERAAPYLDLARLLIKSDRLPEAVALVTRSVEVNPAHQGGQPSKLKAKMSLADLVREAGDLDQALNLYSDVVSSDPSLVSAWIARGWLYDHRREYDKSEADFTRAISLQPERWDGWSGRAFSHYHRRQWEPAIADFSKAIEFSPGVHMNWFHRGQVYINLAQWDKAAADFDKLIAVDSRDFWSRYYRAQVYAQVNKPDEAIADLRLAIASGFKDAQGLSDDKFDPLRDKEGFKSLLIELKANGPKD